MLLNVIPSDTILRNRKACSLLSISHTVHEIGANFQKKKVAEERKKMTEKIKEEEEKEEKGERGIRAFSVCLPLEVALPKPDIKWY